MRSNIKVDCFQVFLALATLLPLTGRTQNELVVFGLTNSPLGTAQLLFKGSNLRVSGSGDISDGAVAASTFTIPTGTSLFDYYGVSVQLGEADSGIYFSPYSSYLYGSAIMVGKTYGQVDGQPVCAAALGAGSAPPRP